METPIITALISASITLVGIFVAYIQWRRDVRIKLNKLREEVTVELLKQRFHPYSQLMEKLEGMSVIHLKRNTENKELCKKYLKIFQDAIYGEVGLLASHNTRKILVYCREGCKDCLDGKLIFSDLIVRVRGLHIALRYDLGIEQPGLSNEVDKLKRDIDKDAGEANFLAHIDSEKFEYKEYLSNE